MRKILIKTVYLLIGMLIGYLIWDFLGYGIGQSLFDEGAWNQC